MKIKEKNLEEICRYAEPNELKYKKYSCRLIPARICWKPENYSKCDICKDYNNRFSESNQKKINNYGYI